MAVEAAVMPIITDNGYEYVGTEVKKTPDSVELIIYIDSKNGVGLDDCEKISRLIDPVIEAQDPLNVPYFLCVSSPGLDRPLKNARDFERSIGKKIDIRMYRAIDKEKDFTGELKAYDDNGFIAEVGGKERTFLFADTALVRLHVDF